MAEVIVNDVRVYRDSAGILREYPVMPVSSTTGTSGSTQSITSSFSLSRASDGMNATSVFVGPASLLSVDGYNARTGGVSLVIYDKASVPNVDADSPKWTVYLPALTPSSRDWPNGLKLTNGLAFALIPDDATGLMAGDVVGLNIGYAV